MENNDLGTKYLTSVYDSIMTVIDDLSEITYKLNVCMGTETSELDKVMCAIQSVNAIKTLHYDLGIIKGDLERAVVDDYISKVRRGDLK